MEQLWLVKYDTGLDEKSVLEEEKKKKGEQLGAKKVEVNDQ